jgi:hypothetical protein
MPVCPNCGAVVTASFARVFGDNHDDIHGCLECMTFRDLMSGAGAQSGNG